MSKSNDMLSVSACAKLVGKHPPQLYKFIENEGMPSHKDNEGHVRVILGEVQDFLKQREASPKAQGGRATKRAQDEEAVKEYVTPFVKQPVLSLWDRGSDKGWAVAAIKEADEITFEMGEEGRRGQHLISYQVDYSDHDLVWAEDRLISEVIAGKIIVAEPQAVLRMLAAQLKLFDPVDRPANIITALDVVAALLDEFKAQRTQKVVQQ